jgi:hypothetical protein
MLATSVPACVKVNPMSRLMSGRKSPMPPKASAWVL